MKKKLSVGKKMLAFVLTFAMVFTAISWGELGEVKAEQSDLLNSAGDFENENLGEWNITGASSNELSSDDSYNESGHSLKLVAGSEKIYFYVKNPISLTSGKTYTLTAYARQTTDKNVKFTPDGTLKGTEQWIKWPSANAGWEKITFSYTASEDASAYMGFAIEADADAVIYLDNITLVEDTYEVSIDVTSSGGIYLGEDFTLTAIVKKNGKVLTDAEIEAEKVHIYWWNNTANTDSWFTAYDSSNGQASVVVNSNGDSSASEKEYEFQVKVEDAAWKNVLAGPTKKTLNVQEKVIEGAPEKVDSELYVPYIEGITDADGFYRGADVSSYLSIKNSGAIYKDKDGNTLNDVEFFKLLKDSGVNTVRIRVWNNPFDTKGRGYGGGNNDLAAAIKMGKWATEAGLGVLIDFHYSDFWADPGKQQAPKAWSDYSVQKKATAISEFTTDSLNQLLDAGVNVTMVQVGNETNGNMCGVEGDGNWTTDLDLLFDAGCDAVHTVAEAHSRTIKAVVHFTNPESSGKQSGYAANLAAGNVSYDVFATSYYPYWHGSLSNLTSVLSDIATKYGKEVMVAETSWATTLADGDGHKNTVRVGSNDQYNPSDKDVKYMYTPQGQANEMASVVNAVKKVGEKGIGVFFWEPIWIPVAYAYNGDGSLNSNIYESNKNKWEQYGSGWASSYAAEYDPKDAGQWYGGSAIDNQSWFDFNGKAMEGINIYKYLQTGTTADGDAVAQAMDTSVEIYAGDTLSLPTQVSVIKVNGKVASKDVTWSNPDTVKNDVQGEYVVNGTVDGVAVNCKVKVLPQNFIKNGGFEDYTNFDISDVTKFNPNAFKHWILSNRNFNTQDITSNNKSGLVGLHFAKKEETDVTATQTVTLNKGKYELSAYVSGANQVADEVGISITVGGQKYENREGKLNGWKVWEQLKISDIIVPEDNTPVTVCLFVENANDKVWGAFDDVVLIQTGTVSSQPSQPSIPSGGSTPTTPPTNTNPEDTTKPDTVVETKPDGSTVETTTETKEDGTKVETVTETATDGSKKETVVETKTDGTKVETVTETAIDGSKLETKKESETNTAGKQVDVATVTKTDADGKVASVVEKSTINEVAKNTTATVTVKKDSEGAVTSATASVAATIEGKKTSLSADVIAQVQEASGQKDVTVTVTAKNDEGKTLYKVKVDTKDLTADNALYIYKVDSKTGELVMVNSKTYKVDENGGLDISIKNKATYELVSKAEAKAIEKQIKATVKVQNSSKDVKKGKTTKVAFDKKMNMNNVKSITYQTADKKIATVSKSGKVTAKAKGTVTVKATVTLKNGSKKTVTMKIKVK